MEELFQILYIPDKRKNCKLRTDENDGVIKNIREIQKELDALKDSWPAGPLRIEIFSRLEEIDETLRSPTKQTYDKLLQSLRETLLKSNLQLEKNLYNYLEKQFYASKGYSRGY